MLAAIAPLDDLPVGLALLIVVLGVLTVAIYLATRKQT
jgi:hypothetical protein